MKINRRGLRILVVDDAITILKVASKHLEQEGRTVETAKNGFVGLNRMTASLETQCVKYLVADEGVTACVDVDSGMDNTGDDDKLLDVVLMDLQMPVMGTLFRFLLLSSYCIATVLCFLLYVFTSVRLCTAALHSVQH